MFNYPDTFSAMLHHGAAFAYKVLWHYTDSIGDTVLGYFAPVAVGVIQIWRQVWKRRQGLGIRKSVVEAWHQIDLKAYGTVYLLIVSYALVAETWKDHHSLVVDKSALISRNSGLAEELKAANDTIELKRKYLDRNDPVFSNITYVLKAFMEFRDNTTKTLHVPNCYVRFTAPDKAMDFTLVIQQLSYLTSGCPTVGPIQFSSNPDEDRLGRKGMRQGKVVFHMAREDSAALKLYSGLSGYLPLELSYDLPDKHESEHYVWFQFGPDSNWTFDAFNRIPKR